MRLLFLMSIVTFSSAAMQVTPQARVIVDAFEASARYLQYGRKQIADLLGLTEAQWKKQFAAEEGQHVSAYRMALAPPDVIREFIRRIAPRFGLVVFDRDDVVAALVASQVRLARVEQLGEMRRSA